MRTQDVEVLAAITSGPKALPLVNEQTLANAMAHYNRVNRPDKVQLRDDCETHITAIENFKDMVVRQLKAALR